MAADFRQMVQHAQVIGGQKIGAPAVLFDGDVFAGALFLHQGVFPAAGLCTHTAVSIPADYVI